MGETVKRELERDIELNDIEGVKRDQIRRERKREVA